MTSFAYTNAVLFGAGQVGMTLMEQLAAEGVQVTLVNRSGKVKQPLPAGVTIVPGDLTDPAIVAHLARDADVVFETAQPEYTEWPARWPPLVRSIIDGMAQTRARLVFVDNLYMYGSTHGQPIREAMPYAATGSKGRVRAEVATLLLDAHKAGKIKVVSGRASDFFGPRVTDAAIFGDRFFQALFAGKPVETLGDINLPHTYTYVPDFARALITLSRHEEAYGRAWHVPNITVSTAEMLRLFGAAVGTPVQSRRVSRLMLAMAGLFVPIVREMKEMLYEFEEPYVVDDSDYRAAFGATLTPLPEAVAATVAWFREHLASSMKPTA